jgi:CDP-diacylglycerol--glycerol-3-phosphate 3-phosphatidyltransferase
VVALAVLAIAVVLTVTSGYEFFREVWKQRHQLRGDAVA